MRVVKCDWHLEPRHFFDETVPLDWTGDGMLVSNPSHPNLLRFMVAQAPKQPTVLIERNHPAKLKVAAHFYEENVMAGRLATDHLLELGGKSIRELVDSCGFGTARTIEPFVPAS